MGMAALVCRHEFVMTAVNLFTEENFAYYDLMLADVLKQYSQENERLLQCFFLDIACHFKPILEQVCTHAHPCLFVWQSLCLLRPADMVATCVTRHAQM
jgi:hypothetical protein